MIYSLPGISKIGWINASLLPPAISMSKIAYIDVAIFNNVNWILLADGATCTLKSYVEKGQRINEAELSFRSAEHLPIEDIAFVIIDANDKKWLIGFKECPRPVITAEKNLGKKGSESSVIEYKVTHKAIRTLIQIL
ncbi:MAG: hypothetical protein K2M31_07785 [Muribaculaceae bacterium]|nr:hypothetical protein [Muribaculaceae bacterium]